ncbi:MAG TPA: PASTA domain-containing protein, partial [Egibacteraceae bacterium]|nr:PASTA domain-containing protein [Egibacteraceae bacterium]
SAGRRRRGRPALAAFAPGRGSRASGIHERVSGVPATTVVAGTPETRSWMPDARLPRPGAKAAKAGRPRRRLPALLAAVLAVALAATGVWAFVLAPPVEVPQLTRMTLDEARAALADRGVELAQADAIHSLDVAEGTIAAQDPAAGANVRKGGTVTVALSLGPRVVTMPRVLGLTRAEAEAELDGHHFALRVDEGWHDSAPAGTVAAQIPEPGADIAEGADVVLYVSKGVEQVTVPDVGDLDRDAAVAALKDAKLTPQVVEVYSDDVPEAGAVIGQSVEAGSVVDKGTVVEVTVSKGPLTVKVPNVEGKAIDEGRRILEGLGLRVTVIEEPRPQVGPFKRGQYGRVEAQDPQPGKKVKRGDTVRLYTFSKAADERDDD